MIALVIVFILYIKSSCSYTPYKRPCTDLSPDCIRMCLQAAVPSFLDGIPEYGLETLDPYTIEKLDLTLPGGIIITFSNGLARGLRNCYVDFARLKVDTLEAQYHCDLTIKGKYKATGRMLMFPIDGDGDSTIKCKNLGIRSVLKFKSTLGADGVKYLKVSSANITHSYDGRVSYSMTNLYRSNPQINKAMVDFMNDNWRMVAEEFGKPLVDFGVSCVMSNLRKLLQIIPIDKIILQPINI